MASVGGNTFAVTVDGVGDFVFRRRTIRTGIAIDVETARLNEGVVLPEDIEKFVTAIATLKVLTAEAPDGWNIDQMAGDEGESYEKILQVWSALRDKEKSFRPAAQPGLAGPGSGGGSEPGILVPPEVPAGADGSEVP